MKIDRHGQAKILTTAEIQLLFNESFTVNPPRDRALFAICLYTACRISEAVTLHQRDVLDTKGRVRPEIIIRKGNTKGKLATRTIPAIADLQTKLAAYTPRPDSPYLFPGSPSPGSQELELGKNLVRVDMARRRRIKQLGRRVGGICDAVGQSKKTSADGN